MKYEEDKRISMKYYPRLFLDETDYLRHLFFVNGNGYDWINGELVCHETEEDAKQAHEEFMRNETERNLSELMPEYSYYGKTPEETRQKEIDYRMFCIEEMPEENNCWFLLSDGRIGSVMYPICQYAKILHVPDDVKPDWLAAAFSAIEMAESDLYRCSEKDKEWLAKAKERLARFK